MQCWATREAARWIVGATCGNMETNITQIQSKCTPISTSRPLSSKGCPNTVDNCCMDIDVKQQGTTGQLTHYSALLLQIPNKNKLFIVLSNLTGLKSC